MKNKLFDLIRCILTIVLAAGFIICIWLDFIIGIKLILTSTIISCFIDQFE